jgi:hypothetical protein
MPNIDDWPNYSLGSKDQLHAMGVLIAAWKNVETAFQALVQLVFPQNLKAGIHTFELLGFDGWSKLIRAHFPDFATAEEMELIEHLMRSSSVCKENRNIVAHAGHPSQVEGSTIVLTGKVSKDRSSLDLIRFDLSALREMADATYATANFGLNLWSAINMRLTNASLQAQGLVPKFFSPLPEKPLLPRKWDQIREAPTTG